MGCDSRLMKVSQLGYMGLNLNHALDLLGSSLPVDPTINQYLNSMYLAFLFSVSYAECKTQHRLVKSKNGLNLSNYACIWSPAEGSACPENIQAKLEPVFWMVHPIMGWWRTGLEIFCLLLPVQEIFQCWMGSSVEHPPKHFYSFNSFQLNNLYTESFSDLVFAESSIPRPVWSWDLGFPAVCVQVLQDCIASKIKVCSDRCGSEHNIFRQV